MENEELKQEIANNDEELLQEGDKAIIFDEFPILISVDEDGNETYIVQTKDYRFAQFLAMIQNNSNLGLIYNVLKDGLEEEATPETINNLIAFCQLLYFWAIKAVEIDDDFIKNLKGEITNESDSDSE